MKNNTIVALVVVIIIIIGGYFLISSNKSSAPKQTSNNTNDSITGGPDQVIKLDEQNGSKETGTATLKEKDGKVTVTLLMSGADPTISQPAHIHIGSCPDVGEVKYPLTSVMAGTSITVLDTTLQELKAAGPLGINVHKSTEEAKVYVSCGNL